MPKQKQTPLGNDFQNAIRDYLYLMEKRYSQKSVLKIVGDRYALSTVERSVLYRGIFRHDESAYRKGKLKEATTIKGSPVYIDGYNVLFTIGSYLNGDFVFLSSDGLLRDASEIHGRKFRTLLMNKAVLLLFGTLVSLNPSHIVIVFDEPVSHSGALSAKINGLLEHYKIPGSAKTLRSPDQWLRNQEDGLIATSDSVVIDHCKVPVIDLPCYVLSTNFNARITDLGAFP